MVTELPSLDGAIPRQVLVEVVVFSAVLRPSFISTPATRSPKSGPHAGILFASRSALVVSKYPRVISFKSPSVSPQT